MARYRSGLYRKAVAWIAENDKTGETSEAEMAMLISVVMVADVWAPTPE